MLSFNFRATLELSSVYFIYPFICYYNISYKGSFIVSFFTTLSSFFSSSSSSSLEYFNVGTAFIRYSTRDFISYSLLFELFELFEITERFYERFWFLVADRLLTIYDISIEESSSISLKGAYNLSIFCVYFQLIFDIWKESYKAFSNKFRNIYLSSFL